MRKKLSSLVAFSLLLSLSSCTSSLTGRLYFDLDGGSFDDSFKTTYLDGESGTAIEVDIPDPYKEGYYFVGWREKTNTGTYRTVTKRAGQDGKSYYYYPYGTDTFYAYFEPLNTITFDLGIGTERGAEFVSPKLDSASFSGNVLNGYTTKVISSDNYLPSAQCLEGHLNFEYWYCDYPLVKEESTSGTDYFDVDTSAELGEYRFDQQFGNDHMAFPRAENFTLHAKWSEDPTITVHFNLDGIEDVSFQGTGLISDDLYDVMKTSLNVDLQSEAERYYYPQESKDNRFAGFYLDSGFQSPFYLNSSVYDQSIDLYLKWEKRVNLTLDYGEGTVGDVHSEVIDSYYENDVLGYDFLASHTPTEEDADFLNFRYGEETFDFETQVLDQENMTLTAVYDTYPELNLHYDYPIGYTGDIKEDISSKIKESSDITTLLSSFRAAIDDECLVTSSYYTFSNGEKKVSDIDRMPSDSIDLYLEIDYRPKVIVDTYYGSGEDYTLDSSVSIESYGEMIADISAFLNIKDMFTVSDVNYLYDGLYSDVSLTSSVVFPLSMSSSHDSQPVLTLHRKMTKAIRLSFYAYVSKASLNQYLDVLPGGDVSAYQSEFKSLLGSYSSLVVIDDDGEHALGTVLPDADTQIYVKY